MAGESSAARQLKRRRITRACDRCHRGGIKCVPRGDDPCESCSAFGSLCTFIRPIKRRGPAGRNGVRNTQDRRSSSNEAESSHSGGRWVYREIASDEVIRALADGYQRIIYPIQPIFHWPTFIRKIEQQHYKTSQSFFAVVTAVCSITSARLRDGAHIHSSPISPYPSSYPTSEEFYKASIGAIPTDLAEARDFDYRRAKALLAILSINYGRVRDLLTHLGDYLTLSVNDGFHNEARWPVDLAETELQERRRLFWSTYCLDVYASLTWGGIVGHRESQFNVLYPAEVSDDEDITEHGIKHSPKGSRVSFFRGWNFVIDLYRILEHAIDDLRTRRSPVEDDYPKNVTSIFYPRHGPSSDQVLHLVERLYENLPVEFKDAKEMTGILKDDRYGFQAANIIVSMQTVKMVITGTQESSVEQRCAIAGELLDAFSTVPIGYIRATSSPMLHHLAGVGHLLGGVIQSPLSQWNFLRVRTVLLALADLLAGLEAVLSFTPGIANKLKAHVSRIDEYMSNAALEYSERLHPVVPLIEDSWRDESSVLEPGLAVQMPAGNVLQYPLPSYLPPTPIADIHEPLPVQELNPAQTSATDYQFQLPDEILVDWPFDIGQGEAFDFLRADWSGGGIFDGSVGLEGDGLGVL